MVVDVLIPTLGRAKALAPLVEAFVSATPEGSYELWFVLDHDDVASRSALQDHRVNIVFCDGTYPAKTNEAARHGQGALILPTADDIKPHAGWLQAALNALGDRSVKVVGTDDLSPVTAQRKLATMPVLRRSYVEDPGAAWGQPGTVFHAGYHHLFVDRELWELAIHRGVAAWADDCVIEHLHPSFGKREVDETDRRGNMANQDADEALFEARREQWLSR